MTRWALFEELHRAALPITRPNPVVVGWRWRYEIGAAFALPLVGYVFVDGLGPMSPIAGVVIGLILLWPPVRSEVWGRIRCVVTAHRIRHGFVEAYIVSRRGKIPVILWCAPAPFGERVWVWCRAGTTATHIEQGREIIAAACWAADVTVRPRDGSPHWVLLEVTRRGRAGAAQPPEPRPARGLR
ncbi:hypothetical protein [Nonomuraea cavernae]|uniref:Uncharacterized protein n=1 Tax=Nonomuraea cavernae TaxID=2045107 RepID=A0A917ZIG7_9ACTN|nr:hypothetical protein [Nonomuraea cavernae]MCA2188346.1 hypothetical protein [Nonomuraea cavernae]GGO83571.1 hypothetical protein GCM10012289_77310 [Nonomuraea cavernae]